MDEIERYLFSEDINKSKVSIGELIDTLIEQPFDIQNRDDALLVARYLV